MVKTADGYFGYNTDIGGMAFAFDRKGVSLAGKKVMILGSGGTSGTAAALCEKRGATYIKVSRSGEINYDNCYTQKGVNIIINATPVGTYPAVYASPVDLSHFKDLEFVFDCTYNPFKTKLLMQAEKLGVPHSDGLPMLIKQALLAEELWGYKIADGEDEDMLCSLYRKKANIVLCGMPSAGKTTVGRALSDILGKTFVDTDDEIFKATGRTPAEIITADGEEIFRNIESEVIREIAKRNSCVIATGGGAVLRGENIDALKMNGVVFWIKRDLNALSSDGRPLSKNKSAEELYSERKEFYKKAADYITDSDCGIEKCADKIAEIFSHHKLNPKKGEL